MLRTCNALRIASLPVLRNDGLGRASPAFAPRRARRTNVQTPVIIHYQLSIVNCHNPVSDI
ncbi:MAG: hypothetical protein LBM98_04525 [Oscillospiraceae bacterium]|nr:hypothetical protein [Oscillospiraceae bacterium]